MNQGRSLPSQTIILESMITILREAKKEMHIRDIEDAVSSKLSLTPKQKQLMHKGNRTMLGYKLAWARSVAKKSGIISSERRCFWQMQLNCFLVEIRH